MKYYGKIGYAETAEIKPGVWEEIIVDKYYYGDIIKASRRLDGNQQINDDVNISNRISIVADPYALNNFMNIRYIEWQNHLWKVSNIDLQPPRMIFDIGGLHNDGN
jgi:hypothetical protein